MGSDVGVWVPQWMPKGDLVEQNRQLLARAELAERRLAIAVEALRVYQTKCGDPSCCHGALWHQIADDGSCCEPQCDCVEFRPIAQAALKDIAAVEEGKQL